jgi:probable DNA metabolism protein
VAASKNSIMMDKINFQYDGSFDGFLNVVFTAFEQKLEPWSISTIGSMTGDLYTKTIEIINDQAKAERVWQGLIRKTSAKNARMVHVAFLSGIKGIELLLWRYLKKIFKISHPGYFQNFLDEDIHEVVQTARKVKKEVHRFHGFVRFQQTGDNIYFAPIDPDHDILPLLIPHFKSRYADQQWVIYDTRRKYGIYYNLENVSEVRIENPVADFETGTLPQKVKDEKEDHYLKLWQSYYDSINIQQRSNKKQMTRLMPRRYWKYLPEKNK